MYSKTFGHSSLHTQKIKDRNVAIDLEKSYLLLIFMRYIYKGRISLDYAGNPKKRFTEL